MSENNKSYRIRTNVGSEYNGDIRLDVNLLQDYDIFEILSLKIGTENLYKYHTSKYGCVVGRVLANGGVGVPNVKISSFIPIDDVDANDPVFSFLYPYTTTRDKNRDNIRYNLLTDTKINSCHQPIGTFPNKRLVLDDNNMIEVFDKYYKFTTTTNASGDYMLFGVPVGNNIIHSDLDLSDIGFLSQKPRDLFYKGYTYKQFENASQFKKDTNLDNLTQVISQDSSIYVFPFWGDETENEGQIKIVRNDIDVNYKFEPTCIFLGCIVSDEKSNAISKNCIPHERMGKMDRLTTGAGTIEMIRKTMKGDVESISIQGNELIDGNGTWCYQIPMNLDYITTDEYGNIVSTDDFEKGLPTRTRVRFRVSLADYESDYENAHLVKVLVPNNPDFATSADTAITYDYEFGSSTKDDSFRDLFWNDVYTVKSYIPRFQKGNRQRNKNFTGFKAVNVNGANNPIPYNNMRINLTFLFVFQCLLFKSIVLITKTLNKIIYALNKLNSFGNCSNRAATCGVGDGLVYLTIDGGMCPTLDGNYIAPGAVNLNEHNIIEHTYKNVYGEEYSIEMDADGDGMDVGGNKVEVEKGTAIAYDPKSSDGKNSDLNPDSDGVISKTYTPDDVADGDSETQPMRIYNEEDYFVKCVELQFAMEYEVIQFDFYNDWINGMIYIPRWFAEIRKNKDKAYYCGESYSQKRKLTQQCALGYDSGGTINNNFTTGCRDNNKQSCHKRWGRKQISIFSKNNGIVTAQKNSYGQYAYYLRPNEVVSRNNIYNEKKIKTNLFSTDIVLLGSVLDCNEYGLPKVNGYTSSTYRMPPPTAEIVSDSQDMNFDLNTPYTEAEIEKLSISMAVNKLNSYINERITNFYNTDAIIDTYDVNESAITVTELDRTYVYDKKEMADGEYLYQFLNKYLVKNLDASQWIGEKVSLGTILTYINKHKHIKFTPPSGSTEPYWVYTSKGEDVNLSSRLRYNSLDFSAITHDNIETNFEGTAKDALSSKLYRLNHLGTDGVDYNYITNGKASYNSGNTIYHVDGYYTKVIETLINNLDYGVFSGSSFNSVIGSAITAYTTEYEKLSGDTQVTGFTFYHFTKKRVYDSQLDDSTEKNYSEISGIDWGYNPFEVGDEDNTTGMAKQVAGHFLEIGCTFSLSNIKSCVNLQRVCELGAEMSQSHYYLSNDGGYELLDPTGIVAKREVSDVGIRTMFTTLNSSKLISFLDNIQNKNRYFLKPYIPSAFMGDLKERSEIEQLTGVTTGVTNYKKYGLIEEQSKSYRAFRFGIESDDVSNKFLIGSDNIYFMPQYENSLYFYFGLRDGNTAIDRLYTEYYAPCETTDNETGNVLWTVSVNTDDSGNTNTSYVFDLKYETVNMNKIKKVKINYGTSVLTDNNYTIDISNNIIKLKNNFGYNVINGGESINITMIDITGKIIKNTIYLGPEVKICSYEQISVGQGSQGVRYVIKYLPIGFNVDSITGVVQEEVDIQNKTFMLRYMQKRKKVTFADSENNITVIKMVDLDKIKKDSNNG